MKAQEAKNAYDKFLTASRQVLKYHLVFSVDVWRSWREAGIPMAVWSDEDLEKAAASEDGLLGISQGVECFVEKPIHFEGIINILKKVNGDNNL